MTWPLWTVKLKFYVRVGGGGTVTFGYGFLVIVPSEQDTLVLHIFNFKACENLLEVPDEV